MKTFMLDTNICSFIIRSKPVRVIERLKEEVKNNSKIFISATVYFEMRYGAISPKASPKIWDDISRFVARLDDILPINEQVIDKGAAIQKYLLTQGQPIGQNDSLIAAHAIIKDCILVSNNTRVPGLALIDWTPHNG